nr:zinc finger BED domain-containing protein RICESLEEPER 3-like isoform X2 [Ipomoea batatas]
MKELFADTKLNGTSSLRAHVNSCPKMPRASSDPSQTELLVPSSEGEGSLRYVQDEFGSGDWVRRIEEQESIDSVSSSRASRSLALKMCIWHFGSINMSFALKIGKALGSSKFGLALIGSSKNCKQSSNVSKSNSENEGSISLASAVLVVKDLKA